jgi:hypothetical protein
MKEFMNALIAEAKEELEFIKNDNWLEDEAKSKAISQQEAHIQKLEAMLCA